MTAKKQELATWMESPNGRGNQWLAISERQMILTTPLGKEVAREEASAGISHFIGDGEREEVAPVPHVGVRTPAACRTGSSMA
jgi:hypothetical protein